MIYLRPFSGDDFPRLISWISSFEMLIQWAGPKQFIFPLTHDQLQRYLAGADGPTSSSKIFTAADTEGPIVGHIEIGAIDYTNQTATLCRVLIAPKYQGKGLCAPLVKEALAVGFEELKLRRIDLRVYGFNTTAINCYRRAGFIQEGLLRRSLKVGNSYWDTVVMAVLREEWKSR